MLLVLFLSTTFVSASELENTCAVSVYNEDSIDNIGSVDCQDEINFEENPLQSPYKDNTSDEEYLQKSSENSLKASDSKDVIVVNDWEELQFYCAQTDRDYTLKLKEDTNFYPTDPHNPSYQIKIKNNVKIIGGKGAYIGDSSSNVRDIMFVAFLVEDNSIYGSLNFENVTFKHIWSVYSTLGATGGTRDGIFMQMGGIRNNVIKNCIFQDILSQYGHATIVYLKKGSATLDNCSFINCTSGYGAVSVYDPSSVKSTDMIVRNCYFENNYASTEPGCINNCGKLTVYNTTFVKNRSFWWAGAIHTHAGGNTTIYDSNFTDNVAGWNGGALYTYAYLQIYNSVFVGNNCTTNNGGGAIGACSYQTDPHIYIENCLFKDNANNCWSLDELSTEGYGRGGAISLMDAGSIEVRDTTFIANSAAYGTAICAYDVAAYGSPDIIIVNNTFINHTRTDDVLLVRVTGTILNVSNNYFKGNSIVFSNLTLTKLSEGKEQATLQVNASLTNPTYYDSDILDKTLYDVYINNKYVKTVNSSTFGVDFGDFDICDVYVIPTISNRKSNEVTITSTREYIFVSKSNGDDTNNGISRQTPVNTIKRALNLAKTCQNIILLDGDYSENNIQIDYDVTIKGEGNATLTNATSFISNSNFTLKNLKINKLNSNIFINQIKNSLSISHCIFTNNDGVLVNNGGFASISNSILLNNSQIITGDVKNIDMDYNWWGNAQPDLNINKFITLNVTSNVGSLENNHKANINVNFYTNENQLYSNLPIIDLNILPINGIANENKIKSNSQIVYTLTAFDDGTLTVNYNDFTTTKSFEFLKSNPSLSLETEDVMVGDDVVIKVNLPSDCEGNLTVNVGNISKTNNVSSPVFTFSDLKAGTYNITVIYSGDKKYLSKNLTVGVNVDKYESTTLLSISEVNVGEDVFLIITTTDSSTGNITLTINNSTQTLTLNNSKASYTIKNIKRGDYRITAVYSGDEKYLSSQDSKFIEVDNLNATMDITAQDIVYGETEIIKITLNDDATGEVTVTVDSVTNTSKVINGKAELSFSNLNAGFKNITVFYSGDDTYFNLTESGNFTIDKAGLTFNISSIDIKIGQVAEITIQVAPRTSGTFTIGSDILTIPMSGLVTYGIADLEIGDYAYTAVYNGNNYKTVSNSTSFKVSEYPIPQVANNGLNTQNTHKGEYETSTNGNVAFIIPFNETLAGDLIIDSFGNVYLTSDNGIYCFNQTSRLWYWSSNTFEGNLSGIAISRDVVIAPKSGDTLYFINQTSGERYGGSNIYQGSSLFSPVVDSNANLYIVSEYQYSSEDYKLVVIPYSLWENGGDPTLVTIGNTKPLCAPTLNDDVIVVISDNRFRLINAKTLETISIKSGNFQAVRPIIGEGNIIYSILSDSIVAYNSNGVQAWKTKVTGGAGTVLALDNEQGLYHVNAKGVLYRYDLIDGKQFKFSDLKVTSGILIDANNNIYFGSNNMFYALDSEGNIIWKSDLGSKIIGNPVMDASGLIYVPTENSITALTYASLSDPDLKVSVDDIVEGQKATITITWNNQTTGIVSYTVNGEDITVNAEDAKVTKVISGLTNGYYDISVSYLGDMRFKESTVTKTFAVRSTDDVANNIQFDGNQTFTFSLNNAQGNLTVNVAGKTYNKALINGQARITIDKLAPGDWDAVVTYSGDKQFNRANRTFSIEIPKYNATLNEVITTENFVSRISVSLPSDATGNLTLSVGTTKKYTETITAGNAVIIVDDLPEGNYSATLTYSGDNNYESVSKTISINPAKIKVILDDTNVIVKSGKVPEVSIKLADNATGSFTVTVDGEEYSADVSEELTISGLEPGNYTATLTYGGDLRYSKATTEIRFEVPKILLQFNDSNLIISKLDDGIIVDVTLPGDARGDIVISVNGTNYTSKLNGGVASLKVTGLAPENYQSTVTYAGSDKYEAVSKIFRFSIGMVEVSFNDTTLSVMSPSPQPVVNVEFDKAVTGNITVTVNNKEFINELIDGSCSVEITGLNPGNYSATVAYSGDAKYGATEKTIQFEVPKITATLENLVVKSNVTVPAVSVMLPSDATGNLTVDINGNVYIGNVINGNGSVELTGLDPGNYTATVAYSGDGNYTDANKTVNVKVPKIIIELNDSNCWWNASQVSVNLNNATGTLTVKIADKVYTEELTDGVAVVYIGDLAPGSYNATILYSGDSKYGSATKIIDVNVPKVVVELDNDTLVIDSQNVSSGVSINLPGDATGTLSVTVDGKTYTETLINGKATVNIPELADGEYNMTVTYSGDGKYEGMTKTTLINVTNNAGDNSTNTTGDNSTNATVKADPVLVISADDVSVGESAVVNVRTSVETGKLIVNVNNKDYELVISNGESSVNISDLAVGNYTVVARFAGDDKFNEATNSTSFSVLKVNVPVTNETISIPESDATEYSVSLPSDATGTLTVTVDGKDYTETLTNGKATVNIPELSEGSHNITVTYSGDGKYSPITKFSVVVKNPANSTGGNNTGNVTGDDNSTSGNNTNQSVSIPDDALSIPERGSDYSISLPADATGTLTVTVDGIPYSQELVNGKATVSIPELAEGSHNITVTYSGDGKYAQTSKSSVVVKEHVPVIKLTASNLSMLYTSGKYFKVRLTSDGQPLANKQVKITINGKTYTKTTDKNGYASMKISLAPKAYTVKATYGNVTITKKVAVKSIITAKNINAKRSAKTVKIKVTLKKVNGKYLKNKKVTLKFNKKTFKVKTNKKGVVTFTIKNSVYKKLKVGKKYTYQVIYGKNKVKKTIKFKK